MRKISVSLCLFTAFGLFAGNVAITNPNFDDQTIADTTWIGDITGWVVSDNTAGLFNPGAQWFSAEAGDGDHKNTAYSNGGLIYQVLTATVASGTTYTLSVDVGARIATDFPGYTIRLMAGGQILATYSGTANSISEDSWDTKTLVYTAGVGAPVGSSLEIHLSSNGVQTNFDNVSLSTDNLPCEVISGDVIKSNTTLHVSNLTGDFATVNEALDCLSTKHIFPGAIVTIQIADGTYTNLDGIILTHPQGEQLEIVGNAANPAAVRLEFKSGHTGLRLARGELRLLSGVTLASDDTGWGIEVTTGARMNATHVNVQDFFEGVLVTNHAYFGADYLSVDSCGQHAFSAMVNSAGNMTNSSFTNSGIGGGLAATLSSTAWAPGATITGNAWGLIISMNSSAHAPGSTLSNTHGNYIVTGGQATL